MTIRKVDRSAKATIDILKHVFGQNQLGKYIQISYEDPLM